MQNYTYHTVNFKLLAGSYGEQIDTNRIPEGKIVCASVCVSDGVPAQVVNLTMSHNSGKKVFQGSNLKDWEQRQGGDYLSSMKPIGTEGGQNYILDFDTKEALRANLEGQVVFVIEQAGSCEH